MSTAPEALFDPEPLRQLRRPMVFRPVLRRPLVVLGSTQVLDDVDLARIERDGIGLRRRRGGGGAVLLRPGDLWLELWLPSDRISVADVRATACRVGEWWREALGESGHDAEVHRGGLDDKEQGAIACFAGIGPGEVTVRGAKLVGISQWRVRQGTLVSSVLTAKPPLDLASYLTRRTPKLDRALCLGSFEPKLSADVIADGFVREVAQANSDLGVQQHLG